MYNHLFTLLGFIIIFSSCSKERKYARKLEGTWDIVMIETGDYYTGDCGVPESINARWTEQDVGVYVFEKGEPQFAGTDENAQPGYKLLQYTIHDSASGVNYEIDERIDFDWYFLADELIIHNPSEFLFEDHVMEDFNKKEWEIIHGEGDECDGHYTRYYLSKQ